MPDRRGVDRLVADIHLMFEILREYDIRVTDEQRRDLQNLHARLLGMPSGLPAQGDPGSLELEFYCLLERHAALRNLWIASVNLGILKSCCAARDQLAALARGRQLTADELMRKHEVEARVQKVEEALKESLKW
jgi:hypothetical protein